MTGSSTDTIRQAAQALLKGELVVMPTETVYGLAADATNALAVARIYEVKTRPRFNPLIVHVTDAHMARRYAQIDERAQKLMDEFWPGPLTLVLPRVRACKISELVSAGLATLAIRAPDHVIAQSLIRETGKPLAAPSANLSGRLSPTRIENIDPHIRRTVSATLDGGACSFGIESTVVGFSENQAQLLRAGAIARQDIERVIGPLANPATDDTLGSPGRELSHYAPRTRLRMNARTLKTGEALLAFGPDVLEGAKYMLNLSPRGDLREAAANFFAFLAELDTKQAEAIAVMPIPSKGLGEALNDRLTRATHLP